MDTGDMDMNTGIRQISKKKKNRTWIWVPHELSNIYLFCIYNQYKKHKIQIIFHTMRSHMIIKNMA